MVVQYAVGEKDEIYKLKSPTESTTSHKRANESLECYLIGYQKICYGNKNDPLVTVNAVSSDSSYENIPYLNPAGVFKNNAQDTRDRDVFSRNNPKEYTHVYLKTNFTVQDSNNCLEQHMNNENCLTDYAKKDYNFFKELQSELKLAYEKSEHYTYQVFAATPSGLYYSYPHRDLNPDHHPAQQSWFIQARSDPTNVHLEEININGATIKRMSQAFLRENKKELLFE